MIFSEVQLFLNSPILRSTRKRKKRKRSLSTSNETQVGTLAKHTTVMKKSQEVRKKLNQTFFVGISSDSTALAVTQSTKEHRTATGRKRVLKED